MLYICYVYIFELHTFWHDAKNELGVGDIGATRMALTYFVAHIRIDASNFVYTRRTPEGATYKVKKNTSVMLNREL